MPQPFVLVLGVAVLVASGALLFLGRRLTRAYLAYRGVRVVACPENRVMAAVELDALGAAWTAPFGRPTLSLQSCTRWPERSGCGQPCLSQIESAPDGCLVTTILADWYRGKPCAFCGRVFESLHWHDHRPALVAASGTLVDWDGFRLEQVKDVLQQHHPVCWDCRVAEGFRREHGELVTERPTGRSTA